MVGWDCRIIRLHCRRTTRPLPRLVRMRRPMTVMPNGLSVLYQVNYFHRYDQL